MKVRTVEQVQEAVDACRYLVEFMDGLKERVRVEL
jgi:hypothetical protein